MIDIKLIRDNINKVQDGLKKRKIDVSLEQLIKWDAERRKLLVEIEEIRSERKRISKEKAEDALAKKGESLRGKIQEKERFLLTIEQHIEDFLLRLPNIPDESVPVGESEKDNRIVRQWTPDGMPVPPGQSVPAGKSTRQPDFVPKPHWETGAGLDILDFPSAAKISGARFALLKGAGAALERAIITFMLELHIKEHGYFEVFTPYLVNKKSITGTGQLPKFEEEVFKCRDDELYLIPTAEVSVTNIHRDEVLEENALPVKYVSYSACFRRESGSYGKDTKGLIRNHQFNKIELVKICRPESSMNELEKLLADAEQVLKLMRLPYRVVELCTADLGFAASKTYDLEVWMPGEKLWREISSCSNFRDFQSRRLNMKYKKSDGTREFVHTINGSGLAVGRTFAAILENYQQKDGSVKIPDVLQKYTGFDTIQRPV